MTLVIVSTSTANGAAWEQVEIDVPADGRSIREIMLLALLASPTMMAEQLAIPSDVMIDLLVMHASRVLFELKDQLGTQSQEDPQ